MGQTHGSGIRHPPSAPEISGGGKTEFFRQRLLCIAVRQLQQMQAFAGISAGGFQHLTQKKTAVTAAPPGRIHPQGPQPPALVLTSASASPHKQLFLI